MLHCLCEIFVTYRAIFSVLQAGRSVWIWRARPNQRWQDMRAGTQRATQRRAGVCGGRWVGRVRLAQSQPRHNRRK